MTVYNDLSYRNWAYPACPITYSLDHPMESLNAIYQSDPSHSPESMFKLFEIAGEAKKISEETYLRWEPRFRDGDKEFEEVRVDDVLKNVAWSFSPTGALALFIKTQGQYGLPDKIQRFTAAVGLSACNFSIRADERNDFEFGNIKSRNEILKSVDALLFTGFVKEFPAGTVYLAIEKK